MNQANETQKPNRSEGVLVVEVGRERKAAWLQWCSERGLKPGKALCGLVDRAISEGLELVADAKGVGVTVTVIERSDEGSKVERRISLSPSEDAAIAAVAPSWGFGYQDWVISALRAALAKVPAYGQIEIEALTQSNLHLVQLLAELREWRGNERDSHVVERIKGLEVEVRRHVETVSNTLAQGVRRWELKI